MEVLTKDVKDLSQRLEVDANAHKEGTGHTCVVDYVEQFYYYYYFFLWLHSLSRAGAM